ncbi:MAG: ATP-binding cassette domain-containing protein [Candidatus Geothermincolia bacterium]
MREHGRGRAETPAFLLEAAGFTYRSRQGDVRALDGIDLELAPGSFTVLLGANGSGKSTLASLLNGLLTPESGSVHSFGLDVSDKSQTWEIRRRVGYILDNPDNQIVAPTVADDVAFGPENLELPHAEIVQRVEAALALMGISELAPREPHLLSEGQKQKVAIAGVIAMGARAIVSDESTSLLDPNTRDAVLAEFRRLRDTQGITIVHITHLADEALLADRVVALERGRVIADRAPLELMTDAAMLERLDMEPPQLLALAGRLRAAGLAVPAAPSVRDLEEALCP